MSTDRNLISPRAYLRTRRLPNGDVRLEAHAGRVGAWWAIQTFPGEELIRCLADFFDQARDVTAETLDDEADRLRMSDGESLVRQARAIRRLYRALSGV
jgi:hypothetical protein